ncbi:MAG: M48 family metalloprotease [Reichenbachiella sp.]|uniref:M48 family metalloprotease n=1 Tax=Reichenbachiella sp. TaxID=2184521 RepID=UPI003298985D
MKAILQLFSLTIAISLVLSCSEESGSVIDQLTGLTPANDVQLGLSVVAQIEADPVNYPILSESEYPEAYAYIQDMTSNIVSSNDVRFKDLFHYSEVKIIDADVLNAFATPGGFIYVYTGLIKYLDTADDLAGVMGHEIAHASERHSSSQMKKQMGITLLSQVILGEASASQLAQMATGFFALKFSRNDEAESDEYSVIYLSDTDYACNGAATFFEKLTSEGQSSGPEFLSTHPSPASRVEDINSKANDINCNTSTIVESGMNYDQFKASLP